MVAYFAMESFHFLINYKFDVNILMRVQRTARMKMFILNETRRFY